MVPEALLAPGPLWLGGPETLWMRGQGWPGARGAGGEGGCGGRVACFLLGRVCSEGPGLLLLPGSGGWLFWIICFLSSHMQCLSNDWAVGPPTGSVSVLLEHLGARWRVSASLVEGEGRSLCSSRRGRGLPRLWSRVLRSHGWVLGPCWLGLLCSLVLHVDDSGSLPSVWKRPQKIEVGFRA